MEADSKADIINIKNVALIDFHRLMIEALRQREGDIIQFVAILAAALAGFGWISKAGSSGVGTDELSSGVFIIGTVGVLFLLVVGAIYTAALGYNYRYITMQLAKIEAKWSIRKSMLVKWPRCPDDFKDKYGCYCWPPEILKVFYLAFLIAIAGVTLSAALLKPETLVLWIIPSSGVIFSLIGWLMPCRYGKQIRKLANEEIKSGNWPGCGDNSELKLNSNDKDSEKQV
jgi:hypothetical protein